MGFALIETTKDCSWGEKRFWGHHQALGGACAWLRKQHMEQRRDAPAVLSWCLVPPEQVRGWFSSCIYQLDRNPAKISRDAGWKWHESTLSRNQSIGLPKPDPLAAPQPILIPTSLMLEGHPGEGSVPSWVAHQAKGGWDKQDSTQLLAKSLP